MAPNTAADLRQQEESDDDALSTPANNNDTNDVQVSFSHVHLYVDHVEDIIVYKQLEDRLSCGGEAINNNSKPFIPQGRDVVKQLLAGFGFRVTGARISRESSNTQSVLVTSKDPQGVQFVVTAVDPESSVEKDDVGHFDASKFRLLLSR